MIYFGDSIQNLLLYILYCTKKWLLYAFMESYLLLLTVTRCLFNTVDRQNPPNLLSNQGSETNQKEENKKVHEAFEQNRDQRIQTAKESNEKQSNPTKASNNINKVRQVAAGTQVLFTGLILLYILRCGNNHANFISRLHYTVRIKYKNIIHA